MLNNESFFNSEKEKILLALKILKEDELEKIKFKLSR